LYTQRRKRSAVVYRND